MTTISVTACIGNDRRLVLELPDDVPPGTHRVTVTFEAESVEPSDEAPVDQEVSGLRYEGNVLVYDGQIVGSVEDLIRRSREERHRHILAGFTDPS